MQDLNQIRASNDQAALMESITAHRRQGKYVLVKYEGLHVVDFTAHDTLPTLHPADGTTHWTLLNPITSPASPDKTLGDYVARKA